MAPERKRLTRAVWTRGPQGKWVAARKTVQIAALLTFLLLWYAIAKGVAFKGIVRLPMQLDPLGMLAMLLASRVFWWGSLFALLVIALTLIFGRAWCGWLCPMGTLLDLLPLKRWRGSQSSPPDSWRRVKYLLALLIVLAALFGNLTLMLLDPLTLTYRGLTMLLLPGLDRVLTALEYGLYRLPWLAGLVSTFDAWVRPALLPAQPAVYRGVIWVAVLFFGILALNLVAHRFWCRYLCPLGGLLGWTSRISLFRRTVTGECKACTVCSQICPTGTIDPANNFASDPAECTLCMDCLEACPRSAVSFHPGFQLAPGQDYDPDRRQALLTLGAAVGAVAVLHTDVARSHPHNHLLRPPGISDEAAFLSRCIRCTVCARACPTGAIQAALGEAGLEGVWTPLLIPRLGYCDYACNACGQACPTAAIPDLDLETKRQQVIGKAYLDQDRCLAWADHQDCIVCEEMCPLPEKAIVLEQAQVINPDGELQEIQLPKVLREACIGCGICEYKCPLNGAAAIRVYVSTDMLPF